MKNARYFGGNGMLYAWENLNFKDRDINVITVKDIIEDCENGNELVIELSKLNMVHRHWEVDREKNGKVRLKNVDILGNVSYIECEL